MFNVFEAKVYAKYIINTSEDIIQINSADSEFPTINGRNYNVDYEVFNTDVLIEYYDNLKVKYAKYWLNTADKDFLGEGIVFPSGTKFENEGWYKIEVEDFYNHRTTYIFLIDKNVEEVNLSIINTYTDGVSFEVSAFDKLSKIAEIQVFARDELLKNYIYSEELKNTCTEQFFIANYELPFYDEVYVIVKDKAGNFIKSDGFILNTSEIYNSKDMLRMSSVVNTNIDDFAQKEVFLLNDINLSDVCSSALGSWSPIGNEEDITFKGTFYGNSHTISNLYINSSDNYVGFFGINEGKILNLTISGEICGNGSKIGGIVGQNNGNLEYCKSNVAITGDGKICGGIVGYNSSDMNYCINYNNVSGNKYVGGICGYNLYGKIYYCGNSGNISCLEDFVGGISGYTGELKKGENVIQKCYNYGNITGTNYCGGITGVAWTDINHVISISYSYNTGNVTATNGIAGGIMAGGFHEYTNLKYSDSNFVICCYNIGNISGDKTYQIAPDIISYNKCYYILGRQNDSEIGEAKLEELFKITMSNKESVFFSYYCYRAGVWEIDERYNNGYICLAWQVE
jgi:hypothetical protein